MNFEALDWEAEAKRVARAFGVTTECQFRQKIKSQREKRILLSCGRNNIAIQGDLDLYVTYRTHDLWFKIQADAFDAAWVRISCEGQALQSFRSGAGHQFAERLVKGLFHLGLLTEEIEAGLEAGVTAHQKMEWALEYENDEL